MVFGFTKFQSEILIHVISNVIILEAQIFCYFEIVFISKTNQWLQDTQGSLSENAKY